MAQPIYFLPGVSMVRDMSVAAKRQILKTAGLGDVFADVKLEQLPFMPIDTAGPGGKSGTIICYRDERVDVPPRFGYFEDQQTWHPVDDGSLLWIGLHNDHPPTPEDMQRARVFRGYEMELGDGNNWHIPIIRRPTDLGTSLPQSQYSEGGKLVQKLKPLYQKYWNNSAEVADAILNNGPMTNLRAHDLSVEVLGINYRFGPNEQKFLGIIDSENYLAVLAHSIDLPLVQAMSEAQKKTRDSAAE